MGASDNLDGSDPQRHSPVKAMVTAKLCHHAFHLSRGSGRATHPAVVDAGAPIPTIKRPQYQSLEHPSHDGKMDRTADEDNARLVLV